MRRKQRQIIAMCTILTMLLPLLAGCGSHMTDLNNTGAQGAENVVTTEMPEESGKEEMAEKTTEDIRVTEDSETEEPLTEEVTTEVPTTEEETTEAVTEPEELFEYEVSFDEIKREVLTVYPGREDGQVKYDELPSGTDGPRGFAVVDDVIYILDTVNFRVNIYDNGNFRSIPFKERFTRMIVENDRIVLSDISSGTKIAVYKTDGTLEATKAFKLSGEIDWINKFFCIGETYVEFVSTSGYEHGRYRYDWSTDKVTLLGKYEQSVDKVNASILSEKKHLSVIGEDGESVYYTYFESNDSGMSEYFLNREEGNVRWYTKVDFYAWHTHPLEHFYFAEDGKLYVMECFEDRTVISEVPLGPKEIAKEDRFVSDNVIEVELETDLEHYRIYVDEIRKEGESYIITGDKIYGGIVVLTVDQKKALDNGALLRLMYGGKEVECIIVGILEDGRPFYFPKNSEAPCVYSSEHIDTNVVIGGQKEAVIDALAKEPYNGVGYYFDDEMVGMEYDLILEKGFTCSVSAELPIDPVCYKAYRNPDATGEWTIARFYEEAVVRDKWNFGTMFDVYTENGEIVRIYEPFGI